MTRDVARAETRWFFRLAVTAMLLSMVANFVGVDAFDLPLTLALVLCSGMAMHRSGWIAGYDAQAETAIGANQGRAR